MKVLLTDEALREALVDAGSRQIKNYSWEQSVQKIQTLLSKIGYL
jgi:hypothetical protein